MIELISINDEIAQISEKIFDYKQKMLSPEYIEYIDDLESAISMYLTRISLICNEATSYLNTFSSSELDYKQHRLFLSEAIRFKSYLDKITTDIDQEYEIFSETALYAILKAEETFYMSQNKDVLNLKLDGHLFDKHILDFNIGQALLKILNKVLHEFAYDNSEQKNLLEASDFSLGLAGIAAGSLRLQIVSTGSGGVFDTWTSKSLSRVEDLYSSSTEIILYDQINKMNNDQKRAFADFNNFCFESNTNVEFSFNSSIATPIKFNINSDKFKKYSDFINNVDFSEDTITIIGEIVSYTKTPVYSLAIKPTGNKKKVMNNIKFNKIYNDLILDAIKSSLTVEALIKRKRNKSIHGAKTETDLELINIHY